MKETPQQFEERLLVFREVQNELKSRKRLVIVELPDGSRQTVERAVYKAKERQMVISTLAGLFDNWRSFHFFDNPREAQGFLLKTDTAKAA